MHDVVEPAFEDAQEHLAGVLLGARRQREVAAELALEDAVEPLELLLLAEADAVFTQLAAAGVHAGRAGAALDGALGRLAPCALEIEFDAFAAAQLANRIDMASHDSLVLP